MDVLAALEDVAHDLIVDLGLSPVGSQPHRTVRIRGVTGVAAQKVVGDTPTDAVELDALTDAVAVAAGRRSRAQPPKPL